MADLAGRLKLAQVHHTDRVNDQMNDVVLGEPVHHVDRQQKPLAAIRGAEEVGHQCFPSAADQSRITPPSVGRLGGHWAAPILRAGGAMNEELFKVFFWILFAPFWLAWKLLALIWQFLVKPGIERHNWNAAATQQALEQQHNSKQKAHDEARANQLAALKAAVPPGPTERMRATIQLNEYKQPHYERRRIDRLIGEHNYIDREVGEDTCFSVDMILQMSETERATIKEHQLNDILLEETPTFTEQQILKVEAECDEEVRATKDLILQQVTANVNKSRLARMKDDRTKTRIGDLLVSPFSRSFDSPHKAKEYADKLKTKFLPEIRKLLDTYSGHKQTETLEF